MAQDARQAFSAAHQTNKQLKVTNEGGDGEVLIGLEEDSPKCVQPTAICSYKVAVRIRDNQGKTVHASTLNATANAERCQDICEKALNVAVVKVVDAAVAALNPRSASEDGGVTGESGEAGELTSSSSDGGSSTPARSWASRATA